MYVVEVEAKMSLSLLCRLGARRGVLGSSPSTGARAASRRVRGALALLLIGTLALAAGCRQDEPDCQPNNLPRVESVDTGPAASDTGPGQDQGGPVDLGPAIDGDVGQPPMPTCPAVGDWYRFTSLVASAFDDNPAHPAIGALNGVWASNIAARELNIFFEVVEVTRTEVLFRAISGARPDAGDASWCLLADSAIDITMQRSGDRLTMTDSAGINIYAGTETIPQNCAWGLDVCHAIPVREAVLAATFSGECALIEGGEILQASIRRSAMASICTCLSSVEQCGALDPDYAERAGCEGCSPNFYRLDELLNSFGNLEGRCPLEDGEPGICVTGSFAAERLDVVPQVCTAWPGCERP